jgi:hypothetical protein
MRDHNVAPRRTDLRRFTLPNQIEEGWKAMATLPLACEIAIKKLSFLWVIVYDSLEFLSRLFCQQCGMTIPIEAH